jgi:hypothetical protein
MDKQRATFQHVLEFQMHRDGVFSARLTNVKGHPKLGNERMVYTSTLQKVEFNNDGVPVVVETRNTVYTQEKP